VCGLVGPHGAGKTTLLEIFTTILLPSAGRASVLGHDVAAHPARVRACVTYAPAGGTAFFPRLTGRQNLEFFAALHDIPHREWRSRAADAATRFQIAHAIDRRVVADRDVAALARTPGGLATVYRDATGGSDA